MIDAIIPFWSPRRRMGIMKLDATMDFVRNVDIVASQIALDLFRLSNSSEMWIPKASENASAIATVRIPPMTASFNPVKEFSPIITPSVVMIPEVIPKDIPIFIDSFM